MEKESICKKKTRFTYPILIRAVINSLSGDNVIVCANNIMTEYYQRTLHIPPTSVMRQTPELCIILYFETKTPKYCIDSINIEAKNFFTDVMIDSIKIRIDDSEDHVFSYEVSKSIHDIITLKPLHIDTFHDKHIFSGFHRMHISMIIYELKLFRTELHTEIMNMFMKNIPLQYL